MFLRPRGADTDVFLTALFPDVTPVLPVRPVGHQAQSLVIALTPSGPPTKRSSTDIHQIFTTLPTESALRRLVEEERVEVDVWVEKVRRRCRFRTARQP